MATPTSNEPTTTQSILPCPLARDTDGAPIELPDGAVGWRVRRHTGGRPRLQLGVDKQPMVFPLTYTVADVEDILPPGTYRLDLVDPRGDALGVTVPITIGTRNAEPDDDEAPSDNQTRAPMLLPQTTNETRLVLEANVRAMQLAFQHNQRTLELGLRTAETLRDGVHVLADAQADWIKAAAHARGFFRNARVIQAPPEESVAEPETADDEDDETPEQPSWLKALVPVLEPIVSIVVQYVTTTLFQAGAANDATKVKPKLQLAQILDWRKAVPQQPAQLPATEPATPAIDAGTLLGDKIIKIRPFLSIAEQARLAGMVPKLMQHAQDPELLQLASELVPLTPEQGAEWLRAHADEIERRFAS